MCIKLDKDIIIAFYPALVEFSFHIIAVYTKQSSFSVGFYIDISRVSNLILIIKYAIYNVKTVCLEDNEHPAFICSLNCIKDLQV